MEITIEKETGSCLQKDLIITLGDYTILAGENNSGKTSIINAIRKHQIIKDIYGDRIIYIPSDSIHPEKTELKTGAAKDAFYKILDKIIAPIFDSTMYKKLVDDFENSPEKKAFIDGVNQILNKDLGVDKKQFGVKIIPDDLTRDIVIKQAVKAYAVDQYDSEIEEVELSKIGMGTQRMIVAALIQNYNNIEVTDKTLFIIEEPEVYLHPKWRKNLHNSLLNISEKGNVTVLITTHDPYFIEMGVNQTIYKVFRSPDPKDKHATDIKLVENSTGKLGYKSDGEINYLIFETPTESYFLELYEHVKDNSGKRGEDFEKFLFGKIKDTDKYDHDDAGWKLTYISRLRHHLGHPKNVAKRKVKVDLSSRLEEAIEELTKLA